jgi:3-hydroxyisobutyrate dehydrogenase-like beta-hydroxyacid dehydrogenase
MRHRIELARADVASGLADALRGTKLIISAVTATCACDVARDTAALLTAGQIYVDLNSVSPATKRANAALVEAAGGHYIDAAVMAPVPPQRLAVPMLLGGARAAELSPALNALGFATRAVSPEVGVASAIKMCRSVMIKGIEALTVECLLAARHHGAESAVLQSLAATFPGMGWAEAQPDYLISRVAEHGRRRAAEMREVAATVQDAGLVPHMALATAARHDALVDDMAAAGIAYDPSRAFSWRELADALLPQSVPRAELP